MKKRIAIIGAGLGGLTLANRLQESAEVVVFEKARGVGGRMSTRRFADFSFDHGAQFFTARSAEFKRFLAPSLASGLVQEWKGKLITLEAGKKPGKRMWFEPHYVACPGMSSLCKKLSEGINVRTSCEVAPLSEKTGNHWNLLDTQGSLLGQFDLVISTAPPAQTSRLFGSHLPDSAEIREERFLACYALMVGIASPWPKSWIAAKVLESPIDWISVNSSKPGRNEALTELVAHSGNQWAEDHVDLDQEEVREILCRELSSVLELSIENAAYISLHRWRYAIHEKAHDDEDVQAPFYDPNLQLASVGDWCGRSRIEQVWLDADRLASQILG